MMMRALPWFMLGLCVACGPPKGTSKDAGSAITPDAGTPECPDNASQGQQRTTADLTAVMVALNPEPAEKGQNTWTVAIHDAAGGNVPGLEVRMKPVMPLHGHGTTPAEFTGTETAPGQYQFGPFNLFMPGTWNVPVRVVRAGMADVELMFHACITG